MARCDDCGRQIHDPAPPEYLTVDDARKEVAVRSTAIFANHHFLGSILDRHEETIQKRWTKKSREQRRKILLTAWGGNMAPTHRPDYAALRQECISQRMRGTKYRDAFMFPHINQEDLTKPKALPLFLNARGRRSPAEFSFTDSTIMDLGVTAHAITPVEVPDYVMILIGQTTPETYGRLFHCKDDPEGVEIDQSDHGVFPGAGLLILEAQDKIMSFLMSCVRQILHEIPSGDLLTYPIRTTQAPLSETVTGFASLSIMSAELPYRPPSQLDFGRIASLLGAARDAAVDHLWALREDPGYFNDHLYDAWEHCGEIIKDKDGQMSYHGDEDPIWASILAMELHDGYSKLEIWSDLMSQTSRLREMQETYADRILPEKALPEDYMRAILLFRARLVYTMADLKAQMRTPFRASAPWRHLFVRVPSDFPFIPTIRLKHDMKLDKLQDQLSKIMDLLTTEWENMSILDVSIVVDELQRLIDSERKAKCLLTSRVAQAIAELSIITECLRQLELYQPWAINFNKRMKERTDLLVPIKEQWEVQNNMHDIFFGAKGILGKYGSPRQMKFYYPVDKRKTRETVETMCFAEKNLDMFWEIIDRRIHQNAESIKGLPHCNFCLNHVHYSEQHPGLPAIHRPPLRRKPSQFKHYANLFRKCTSSWNNAPSRRPRE